MVRSRKKKQSKSVGAGKPKNPNSQTGTMQVHEQLHHDFGGTQFAGAIISQAFNTVQNTGVDKSLINILKTVRNWPTRIDETGSDALAPPFNATEIRAEETTKDGDIITSVSFSYSGEVYDFISRIKEVQSGDKTLGTINLHENGEQVIDMEIVQNENADQFSFCDLNSLKFGPWIDNIVRIDEEIEAHNESLVK